MCVYGESCKGFNEMVNSLPIIYYPWMHHHQLICCGLQICHHRI